MIKIEVTGASLGELADKLSAIADSFRGVDNDRIRASGIGYELQARKKLAEQTYAPPAEPVEINPVAPTQPVSITPAKTEEVMPEPSAPAAPALNFDTDVAPVVLRAVATKGKPFVEAAMAEFGVERASQLDAARWAELIDRLDSPF